ncbi:MAG TPA: pitrilysin family protein [Candidatus Paceibacterota bacterium]|nr:pitrilysin family protein [Candidatus Paceibacterota bacterium]
MQNGFSHQFDTFDSGLRLITVPMGGTKTVTVLVLVGTGSKYETKEINGISHFLEHMMFKGTTKRPGYLDISRELDSIGAEYNAFTSKEYTGYYAKASSQKLDVIMDVVFDIFLNSKLDGEAIKVEKGVIIEELNMYRDDPPRYVGDLFERLLYGDQPAGWDVVGEKEIITKLERKDFVEYFNTHYIAENTVVAIAGDIDPVQIKEKVMNYFAEIRQGKPVTKLAVTEKQIQPQTLIHSKKTDQTHFHLGFRAYNIFDPRKYPLSVLATILGGGMSSRLFDEVREKRGLAYYVRAGKNDYTDSGSFVISAGVNNERAVEAIEVITEEIRKVKKDGVTPQELHQAIDQIIGRTALALEHSDAVAETYADPVLFQGKVLTPEEELDKIKKVTLADIMQVTSDIFQNEKLNLALIGPFDDSSQFEKLLKV